jgi:PTS system cellobiose-specific IIC component
MQEKVLGYAKKIQDNIYLSSISQGLMQIFPILLLGSFALLLAVLPIDTWQNLITNTGIRPYMMAVQSLTVNSVALYASFSIGGKLASFFNKEPMIPGVISVFAFLVLTPLNEGAIDPSWLSAQGLFVAMIASLLATRIYVLLIDKGISIKMPDSVPPFVSKTFASLVPVIVVGTSVMVISWLFTFTSYGSFADLIYSLVALPLQGLSGSVWSLVFIVFIQCILWFLGVHGSLVVASFIQTLYVPLDVNQQAAVAEGVTNSELPHILGQGFYSVFSGIGGAGGTLSLVIIMLLFGKAKQNKTLAGLSIVPGLFTVNEPVIFGFPLILNPIMAIPFISVPIIQTLVAYFAMALGLAPRLNGVNPGFGLPVLINGFMTGGWRISLLQLICVLIGCAIW